MAHVFEQHGTSTERGRLGSARWLQLTAVALVALLAASVLPASAQTQQPLQIGADLLSEGADDQFGYAVSLSADGLTLAVGAYRNEVNGLRVGHVRVFRTTGGSWSQVGSDIDGDLDFTTSGSSISLSADGSRVAINSPTGGTNKSGQVRVFELVNDDWSRIGQNVNGVGPANFGRGWVSLSADGSTFAVGSTPNDGEFGGEVRVHRYEGGTWQQVGAPLASAGTNDRLGSSAVSLSADGSILAAGAAAGGYARVYEAVDGEWQQIGSDIESSVGSDNFGWSISMSDDGSVIAVGAPDFVHDASPVGRVLVFRFEEGEWQQVGQEMRGQAGDADFGAALSLSQDGMLLAVGAPLSDVHGPDAGRAAVYENADDVWVQAGSDIAGTAAGDRAGESVALSADGSVLAVGANQHGAGGQVRAFALDGPIAFCDGIRATLVGTSGDDDLVGTSGPDVIAALQGNDIIWGLAGDDIICAGMGDDVAYGGRGFDVIFGAQGNDEIYFAAGAGEMWRFDSAGGRAYAGAGDDVVYGSTKWDRMQGGPGNDMLVGFEGRDWIRAGAGADAIDGGLNVDDVHGGNGNDHIVVTGNDRVRGGAGALDACVITAGSTPQPLISCEIIGIVKEP